MSKGDSVRRAVQILRLRHGDCVEVLKGLDEASVGAFCCDPPYGLEFMGKKWDRLDWTDGGGMMGVGMGGREIPWPSYSGTGAAGTANATCATCAGRMRGGNKCSCDKPDWRVKGQPLNLSANAERMRKQQDSHRIWLTEAYRVLRPGGIIKAFSGTRTFHRMTAAMQEAGFVDLRMESWNYGSGFPKSLDLSKEMDRLAGAEREVVGVAGKSGAARSCMAGDFAGGEYMETAPATDAAKKWTGYGTALKPSWEPVCVGRKPE